MDTHPDSDCHLYAVPHCGDGDGPAVSDTHAHPDTLADGDGDVCAATHLHTDRHPHTHRDRYRYCDEYPYQHGHAHGHRHANRDAYIHTYPHGYRFTHRVQHADRHTDGYVYADPYSDTYPHADLDTHGHGYTHAHRHSHADADCHADLSGDHHPGFRVDSGRRGGKRIQREEPVKRPRLSIQLTEEQQLILGLLLVILLAVSMLYCLGFASLAVREIWEQAPLPGNELNSPEEDLDTTPSPFPTEPTQPASESPQSYTPCTLQQPERAGLYWFDRNDHQGYNRRVAHHRSSS